MTNVTTVTVAGVGGQGILLAAAILANAALADGLDVKASEVKGMAQRGGSVIATVRFGRCVYSPVAAGADLVVATELLEGRRSLDLLPPHGAMVCSTTRVSPGSVLRGEQVYPDDMERQAAERRLRVMLVDADSLARRAGTARAANVVLLGAASIVLPFSLHAWQLALERTLPAKILKVNKKAFALGRKAFALGRNAVATQEVPQ